MSSDPKKPGFDAPPAGTPDLLQKDLNLDRRQRAPSFEQLQAQKGDAQTDPLRPATPRPPAPIPQATVPARPGNLDEITQAAPRHVPPGLAPRQPALHIRTPTPPTQPARMAVPIEAVPTMQQPTAQHPRPMPPPPPQQQMQAPRPTMPPASQQQVQARPPMPPPPQQARPPMPPPPQQQQTRPPMPPAPQPQMQAPRPPMPPPQQQIQARPPMPPPQQQMQPPRPPMPSQPVAARPPPAVPPGPQTNTIPVRTPVPPAQPNAMQAPRPPNEGTGAVSPQRTAPPSPTEFAQARPQVMPQVTPAKMMQGALVPEGQQVPQPQRPSQAAMNAVPALPPRAIDDEPEPRTTPAGNAAPRSFTPPPAPAPVPRPAGLPAEMLVTQPGAPGPFAPGRSAPQQPQIELAALGASTSLHGAHAPAEPVFEAPKFDEPRAASSDTVTAEPASLWRRSGAWIADLALVGGIVLALLMAAMTVIAPKALTPIQQLTAVAIPGAALGAILAFVYTTLFAFLWNGRTPGRRIFGIHLVDSTGHAPSFARAMFRAVFSLVSFGFFLSGFWLALFDRHGQTLHDKLTRTFVVKLQDA